MNVDDLAREIAKFPIVHKNYMGAFGIGMKKKYFLKLQSVSKHFQTNFLTYNFTNAPLSTLSNNFDYNFLLRQIHVLLFLA